MGIILIMTDQVTLVLVPNVQILNVKAVLMPDQIWKDLNTQQWQAMLLLMATSNQAFNPERIQQVSDALISENNSVLRVE